MNRTHTMVAENYNFIHLSSTILIELNPTRFKKPLIDKGEKNGKFKRNPDRKTSAHCICG